MAGLDGFSFLLGAGVAWFFTKEMVKESAKKEFKWDFEEIARTSPEDLEKALEESSKKIFARGVNIPRGKMRTHPDGSQYLHLMKIKDYQFTLRTHGWSKAQINKGSELK